MLCQALGVSTSGYYDWRERLERPARRTVFDEFLTEQIREIHTQSRGTYGSPRVHAELVLGEGIRVGQKRVERLMRQAGLEGIYRRKKHFTTRRDPKAALSDDLVNRQFSVDRPDALWVGDVTEHPTAEGKVYLATVIDAFSRRVVGWSIADHLRAEIVVDALQMAIWRRNGREAGTVMHTDHGSQIHLLGLRQTASRGRHPRLDGLGRRCPRQRHGRELLRHLAARAVGPPPLAEPRRARLGHL